MKILAVDTSSEYCSAALLRGGELDAREVYAGQRHSELLLGMVDELLRRNGLRLHGLDGIAFGEGPGSFTGLRIACGVAQGLAFAAGVPVIGIGTLLAMAHGVRAERVVCCIDARMHEIYHAAYERRENEWKTVHGPTVCPPALAPLLPDGTWFAGGNGFAVYRETLMQRYDGKLSTVDPKLHPRAEEIARLAVRRFERGEGVEAAMASPLYVRDKVALKTHER